MTEQFAVADAKAQLPVGNAVVERLMSLPIHPNLDEASLQHIAASVQST
jgi:UDP-2-acetamido-2-deoxy-ribo-hexuluronate aminotransferase